MYIDYINKTGGKKSAFNTYVPSTKKLHVRGVPKHEVVCKTLKSSLLS